MASNTGGVKAFSIQGRLYRERERLHGEGMTVEERAWRKQWIKDQKLHPSEPRVVPELYKELYNPFRRAYWYPLDRLFKPLEPVMGKEAALLARKITGKFCMAIFAVYCTAYYFKYNHNDWTRKGGWRVLANRVTSVPGDPNYPASPNRFVGADYSSRGFKDSPI
ncbi:uncharacterized protein LOC106665405 [Cimex lectularius]|uniref:NADH dehydrogenase [ubiquinone] 1 beta subcomplex subunit 6 n=1 Tax=Cimex lectularius TaxID=79782 RepID=A0A8I6RJD3_CIMLE|nr:uncharacterized protein LOC106665405 [Cimex lectularius]